jgi:trigger factor
MQAQISEISPVLVQVSVEVPWADVEKAIEGSYITLSRSAKVKGFRQGKVPRNVLKQLFGAKVKHEVVNNLVESGIGQAVEQHKLAVVAVPPLEAAPQLQQGQPLSFSAKIEVRPRIDSVDMEGLTLVRESAAISNELVEEALERLRQQHAEVVVVEPLRPVADGDLVTCDYTVAVEGVDRPDLAGNDRPIDTNGGLLPELKAGLLGKSVGESASIDLTFPANQGELSNKPAQFSVTVKEIKAKVLPTLDDEFAKDVEHVSLEDLRTKTRERLEAAAKERAEDALKDQLVEKLLEKNPVQVPPSLVQQQQQALLQEYVRMIRMTGQSMNTGAELFENTRKEAEQRVRAALVLGAVARIKGIRVEAVDLDKRLEEMAARSGKHVAKLRAELQGEQRDLVQSQILEEKLLEYLLGQATITESAT